MNQPTPIAEIIKQRTSRRTYLPEPLPDPLKKQLEQMMLDISSGPLGTGTTFSLICMEDFSNRRLKLGTYGFIQGARYFVAGQIIPSREGYLDYGYNLEKLILEFTRLGLGTCWLGGTFNRSEFAKAIHLKGGHVIPAISPLGFATPSRGLGDRLIRLGAGSRNRLPPDQLFFDKKSLAPLVLQEGTPIKSILDAVRAAPSASNIQPWRIAAEGDRFSFYLARKPGYKIAFEGVDMQMIDMGIAMAHFDLVAREHNKVPEWKIPEGTIPFKGWEQVISVFLPR